jgi:DNA repair protein RadC
MEKKKAAEPEAVAYRTRIKDWPEDERPREKLLSRGVDALSDAELLAILIRSGTGSYTAVDLGKSIIAKYRTLRTVSTLTAGELMRVDGIGQAKAVELLAAFEIGRRVQKPSEETKLVIHSPEDVAKVMSPRLRERATEAFFVLLLDSMNGLKKEIELSTGTLNASLVHPREVFKEAIDHRAASVIVVHNHPSGNREPSREDIEITRQLVETGKVIGIPLHDHVIIAGDSYTSFAERALL